MKSSFDRFHENLIRTLHRRPWVGRRVQSGLAHPRQCWYLSHLESAAKPLTIAVIDLAAVSNPTPAVARPFAIAAFIAA